MTKVCHCGAAKDYKSAQCQFCANGIVYKWTPEMVEFLRTNYPTMGKFWCGERLGIPANRVRGQANVLKIGLLKEVRRQFAADANSERMKANNPSHLPGASVRLSAASKARPDVLKKLQAGRAQHREAISQRMRDNNPSHLPGASERLSRDAKTPKRLEALLNSCVKNQRDKPSGLERKLWRILDGFGIAFESQIAIKDKFVVDVKIGSLIVEADGEWWHGHPRFEPLNARQIAQQKRDTSRNKYLAACGYSVVRIWEGEMTSDRVAAVLRDHNLLPGE